MTKFKSFFVLFLTSLLIVSCNPSDDNNNSNGNFSDNFGNATSKDFLGQVVDEDNNPIQNVAVKIGSSTAQTDVNGVFIINDANVYEKFAYITAKKSGFIDGSRAVVPSSGTNTVKIMMLSGNIVATVASGAASEVALPNAIKVVFDGNFKTETGSAYSGNVSVIMHHLDPTDPNIADKMPGMLFAENADGAAKVLETFGMMNVELRGSGGEKLQISNTAQIEMPITATQLATAPSTIPLWHFDETLGYWKEEGSATKQGNKYVGTVSHFSWWNCDAQFPTVTLCVTLVNSNGNPISNVGVGIIRNGNSYPVMGMTNSDGQVCGLVPANETLTMNIYDNCGNIINTSSIGPLSANTTLPNIVVTSGTVQSTTVQGSLLKCDNSNVTNGYVLLDYGNQTLFSTVTNGNFSFNTLVCSSTNNSFTLEGYDYDNLQTTGVINYTFTTPTTNVGNLTVCNAVTEFISYQIDNNPVVYVIAGITANSGSAGTTNGLSISGYNSNQQGLYIWGNTNIPGIYTTAEFSIEGSDIGYISVQSTNAVSFNLSNFGSVGQYIDMTFNGTYIDSNTSVSHTITGTVHVLRDN
ncbi:hypothetical protein [Flavobacterium sp.]|uniref:hypothetical protein n=1 Tax=Flavobacterium sp. TaxID=239 RepID=UPI002B4B4FC4|nr:hypothetical protein [Flavobacterium sp.]HLF51472.1 hypothetical protein [Flavobacterium sp.]